MLGFQGPALEVKLLSGSSQQFHACHAWMPDQTEQLTRLLADHFVGASGDYDRRHVRGAHRCRRPLVAGSADHVVAVPSTVTAHVQEIHLLVIHVWCAGVDEVLSAG